MGGKKRKRDKSKEEPASEKMDQEENARLLEKAKEFLGDITTDEDGKKKDTDEGEEDKKDDIEKKEDEIKKDEMSDDEAKKDDENKSEDKIEQDNYDKKQNERRGKEIKVKKS